MCFGEHVYNVNATSFPNPKLSGFFPLLSAQQQQQEAVCSSESGAEPCQQQVEGHAVKASDEHTQTS